MKRVPIVLVVLLVTAASIYVTRTLLTTPDASPAAASPVEADYGRLPLHFEENRGQADSDIRFLSRSGPLTLALTADGAEFLADDPACAPESAEASGQFVSHRVRLTGARATPSIDGEGPRPGKSHYLVGRDRSKWHTHIPQFGAVRYVDVYPGIDLVFHGRQGQLEFDFVVAPGRDPAPIHLDLPGGSTADADGSRDIDPLVYQAMMFQPPPREGVGVAMLRLRLEHLRLEAAPLSVERRRSLAVGLDHESMEPFMTPPQAGIVVRDGGGRSELHLRIE